MSQKKVKEYVKARYGEIAKTRGTCCCSCDTEDLTEEGKSIGYTDADMESIPEEANMGLGCGNPVAFASIREGETVLDLGSGGGIDVFLAADRVGLAGRVIGVDMTEAMIERATESAVKHGYRNVEFRLGEIEKLPVDDSSVDVVLSNCVINLSPDKDRVFKEAYRVLRRGGRLVVSDIVTEGELPEEVRQNLQAWACCVGGAMEKNEYLESIANAGFKGVRVVSSAGYESDDFKGLKGRLLSVCVEAYKDRK